MTAPDPAKKLHALLKSLRSAHGEATADGDCAGCPAAPEGDHLLWRLVFCFLAWEAPVSKACAAARKLHSAVIDYNEMRVCLPDEIAGMIGERYPRAIERAARLRSVLNELYRREHAVSLAKAANLGKREAREYLESLEGMPPFVAARMALVALGGHAFPLDERTHAALQEEGAVPPGLSLHDASGWLERQFRAGEALPAFLVMERWMNDRAPAKTSAATAKKPEKTRSGSRPPPKRAAKS